MHVGPIENAKADRAIAIRPDAKFEVVHADVLRFFSDLVAELGGDASALLRQARIDPAVLAKRDAVIEYRALVHLLEHAAEELNCPDFGMRFANRQRGGKVIGPIGVVMRHSRTVGQALGYCMKHIHAYSLATRVRFRPDRLNHRLFLSLDMLLDGAIEKAQVIEHALMLANLNLIDITGGAVRAREVSFRHQPLSPLRLYRSFFGCDVRFGQPTDGIMLTEQDLVCPIVDPDEQVLEMATAFIDSRFPTTVPPMHARIRCLIQQRLGGDDCTNERVAGEMCMHPRTLQRRLRSEGASFEKIKDDVRREIALRHLEQGDMPLTGVAEKLGYAEVSVLSRSCYRWFGVSPLQLRRRAMSQTA